ncbi:MAG: alpha-glucosidase C-terminal domain-containing protein [Actinomycetota bacterium]
MLALFRRLVHLQRKLPALALGSYRPLDAGDGPVLAYLREHEGKRVLVALNFGPERRALDLSGQGAEAEALCSTHLDRTGSLDLGRLELRPGEGIVASLP